MRKPAPYRICKRFGKWRVFDRRRASMTLHATYTDALVYVWKLDRAWAAYTAA